MGKSLMSLNEDRLDLKSAFAYLKKFEVTEASEVAYFNKQFILSDVVDIEIGVDGTDESVFRFKNGGFAVVDKTIDTKKLKPVTHISIGGK